MTENPQPTPSGFVKALVNPLAYQAFEPPEQPRYAIPTTAAQVLEFMCQAGVSNHPDAAAARYRRISEHDGPLSLFPDETEMKATIVGPLRNAKAAFMTGNYTATIALAGAVGEALADLTFRIHEPSVAGNAMSIDTEHQLFGMAFAKLGQRRRVSVLVALRIIGHEATERFDDLNRIRNTYLHPGTRDKTSPADDAVTAYAHAVWLAGDVIGRHVRDGAWGLRTPIYRYLQQVGLVVETPPSDTPEDRGSTA